MTLTVLASANAGKLAEFRRLLQNVPMELVPQSMLDIQAVEETGKTFRENALLKARHASRGAGLPAVADDSGLLVDALGGRPGVRSARFAGEGASDGANVAKLLRDLAGVAEAQRTARFECVVAYVRNPDDAAPVIACGTWRGRILCGPRGDKGFGYDPVFLVPELGLSAAELSPSRKDELSHRGQALRALAVCLLETEHGDGG